MNGVALDMEDGMASELAGVVSSASIREDFVPKDDYFSPEFARYEAEHVWPRVWQIACREEEIPEVGNFITYDIARDSITVLRSDENTIRAYHNVCMHRGRKLTEGCGKMKRFHCRFHGWQWNLEGENIRVVDRDDWGEKLKREEIALAEVQVECWGGFVWINMDADAPPLREFLGEVYERCDLFEFEKLRYRWYKTVVLPVNWKVPLEAFNEGYHVQQTHSQLLPFLEDYTGSVSYGLHGAFWTSMEKVANPNGVYALQRSSRLGGPPENADYRKYVLDFVEEWENELKAMVTPRAYDATQRLKTEVEASATQGEVLEAWARFQMEAATADGAGWPEKLTPEYVMNSHVDWHVFPNSVYLHGSVDGVLWYRCRPNGADPESCIFDVWSLMRYAPGKEPPLVREFYEKWTDTEWGRILTQDFENFSAVQEGMQSRAFRGSRTNPVQERAVFNFHRALHQYIEDDPRLDNQKAPAVPLRRANAS